MITFLFVAFALILGYVNYRGFPGSIQYIGWKISGIWENGPQTIQVLIHNNGPMVRGHVVWANEDDLAERGKIIGSLILKEVKLKPFWRWSNGTYIDPVTNREFPLRIRLKNNKSLTVHFYENAGGEVLIKEEWQLVNPLV
mgnify:CR=1 FL=1